MQIETWPLLLIEWDDAESDGDAWETFSPDALKKESLDLQKCVSVGWLLRENKEIVWLNPHFALTNERSKEYSRFGGIRIPKVAITKRVLLVDANSLINPTIPLDISTSIK